MYSSLGSDEILAYEAALAPFFSHGDDTGFQLFAVVRAVVHGNDSQRIAACLETLIQHSGDNAHRMMRSGGACFDVGQSQAAEIAVKAGQGITFLCDRKADHLQGRIAEDGLQLAVLLSVGTVSFNAVSDGSDDALVKGPVRMHLDQKGQIVKRSVDLVDNLEIEGLGSDDTGLLLAGIQQLLLDLRDESAENVACSEMYPYRILLGLSLDSLNIKFRQNNAGLLPLSGVLDGTQG